MNQILQIIPNNKDSNNNSKTENKNTNSKKKLPFINNKKFIYIFILCIILFFITISSFFYNIFKISQNEHFSDKLNNNYNIMKLYSNKDPFDIPVGNEENEIIGNIQIPAINLSYPFFSSLDNDSLSIFPCRFHGNLPPDNSNLCIAGHNYDNGKFFSDLHLLKIDDEINIKINNTIYKYSIFKIYEVSELDLSPVYSYESNKMQLTLVTCNNLNKKRLIVKANFFSLQ